VTPRCRCEWYAVGAAPRRWTTRSAALLVAANRYHFAAEISAIHAILIRVALLALMLRASGGSEIALRSSVQNCGGMYFRDTDDYAVLLYRGGFSDHRRDGPCDRQPALQPGADGQIYVGLVSL